jgi:hypothetical protein
MRYRSRKVLILLDSTIEALPCGKRQILSSRHPRSEVSSVVDEEKERLERRDPMDVSDTRQYLPGSRKGSVHLYSA